MIPALIIWLFKKYGKSSAQNTDISIFSIHPYIKYFTLILVLLLTGFKVTAQDQTFNYNILHNGSIVGHMQLQQRQNGDDIFLRIASEVKMRFIFGIQVNVEEESHYFDGKLVSSHVHRIVNGKEKANKYTKASGNIYQLIDDGKTVYFNHQPIKFNLGMMYLKEPVGISQTYSDNFQQYVPIKQLEGHTYRIDLPDGNYNFYTYANGICSMVEVHHSIYKIQIQLT